MRRGVIFAIGAVALLVVVGGALFFARSYLFASAKDSTGSDDAHGKPVRVHTIVPKQGGPERTVTRPGAVHSFQHADLFAKVTGYLTDQKVDIGSVVKENQLLAKVYAPEIATRVRQAEADLKKAEAQVDVFTGRLNVAKADVREARVKVEQAKTDVENAVAMLSLRKKQNQRIKELVDANAVERELLDEKIEARKAAESNERAVRMAVETAKVSVEAKTARVAAATADVEDAKAQVDVAKAALARAQVFEDYTKLRAPFPGVITRRTYHEGDFIRAGSDQGNKPVLRVARLDKMRVVVDVPDPDVPFTRIGEDAELRVSSLPGKVFSGKVARTARAEDPDSRTMRTEIDLPNPKDILSDGMFGRVTIKLGADPDAVTIPSACLVGPENKDERAVYVVRDGKAHKAPVHVGRDDGVHAEILAGLRADDQVIDRHGPGLADQVPVVEQKE